MRHSLAQLLAASSGQGRPGEPAAACSFPSPAAERRTEEETEAAAAAAMAAEDSLEEPDEGELLFPAGLELDAWLEAAVVGGGGGGEASSPPAWGGASPPAVASSSSSRPSGSSSSSRPARPGSNRLKAAAAARLNRQKKKLYVQGLETRLQGLAAENRQLRDRNRGLCRRLRDLERETGYLRAVLANQSALGRLLGRLAGDGAGSLGLRMRVSTSLFQETAAAAAGACGETGDHDYALPVRAEDPAEEKLRPSSGGPGGVCLHVDRDHLSVEFCSLCAKRAASSETWAAAPPLLPPAAAPSLISKIFSFRCLPCQASLCRG